jgi:hypothetical protein
MWEVELYDLDLNREYRINGVERSRSEYYNGVTFFLDSYEHDIRVMLVHVGRVFTALLVFCVIILNSFILFP